MKHTVDIGDPRYACELEDDEAGRRAHVTFDGKHVKVDGISWNNVEFEAERVFGEPLAVGGDASIVIRRGITTVSMPLVPSKRAKGVQRKL